MQEVFSQQSAEALCGDRLLAAQRFLVESLAAAIGFPLEIPGDNTTIHSTEIRSGPSRREWHIQGWKGFIGSTSYLGEGRLAYGAFLFPFIGSLRTCALRRRGDDFVYDYAFRYLLLKPDVDWEDLGWQIDHYGEFEHWYVDEG